MKKASELFEVVIFTASQVSYADTLINQIDPFNYVTYRLFREHCTICGNSYVKDISRLGRDMKNIIFVDNSVSSFMLQPENAINIPTWVGDKADTELIKLMPLLEFLAEVPDVRIPLSKIEANKEQNFTEALCKLKRKEEEALIIEECIPTINEKDDSKNIGEESPAESFFSACETINEKNMSNILHLPNITNPSLFPLVSKILLIRK